MRPKPHLDLKKNGARWTVDYRTPELVLPNIKSKMDLMHALEYHSNPHIKMHTPDDPKARRHHVENVRPALRWFCKKFGVNIPSWLEGNMHYDEISPEHSEHLFGTGPLKVRDYEEWSQQPENPEGPSATAQ